MAITTRTTTATGVTNKGEELTYLEMDTNFIELKQDKYESGDNPTFGTITSTVDIDALDMTSTGTITANVITAETLTATTFTSTAIDDNSTAINPSLTFASSGLPTFSTNVVTSSDRFIIQNASSNHLIFNDTTADRGEVRYDHTDNSMKIITEGTFAIHIDSSQQVGIGTDIPSSALDVAGDIECVNLTATTQVTAADFNTTSDYRVKENVIGVDEVSELIDYLNVVEFNFKDNPEQKQVGFIAHELQSVIPGVVTGEKDGEELQTINMTKLVPYLVKALQESNAKIKQLEEKISELK
jgi:hypothetical protein